MHIRQFIFVINLLVLPQFVYPQVEIISLDPPQNALSVPKNANLTAVLNIDPDLTTVVDSNIVVFAKRTGSHFGTLTYNVMNKTLKFDPDKNFLAGERVTVTLTNNIKGVSGESFRGFSWHFTVQTFAADHFEFVFKGEWPAGQASYFDATDLNNDGFPDLVAADFLADKVYLYLNDQQGHFYFHKSVLQGQGNIFSMIQFRDFNRDGLTDIYVDTQHLLLMNLSNTDFQITRPKAFSQLLAGYDFIADYDNDGYSDIVISLFQRDSLWVYKGFGKENFQFQYHLPLPATGRPSNPAEGTFDMNSDGQIDLIAQIFDYNLDSIFVLLNTGALNFDTGVIYDSQKRITSGDQYTNDLDNDGDLDHAVFGATRSEKSKFFMFNDGSGQFEFGNAKPFETYTTVSGGDFDTDGDIDLVAGWGKVIQVRPSWISEGYISILKNQGNQNFVLEREMLIGEGIGKIMFLDIDRDDDLDIVGMNGTTRGRNILWLENTFTTQIDDNQEASIVENFRLNQNFPNPFNGSTMISYTIQYQTPVILNIYDTNGKEVKTLVNQIQNSGTYYVPWNGSNKSNREVSSGIYIVQMQAGKFVDLRKVLLLK